MISDEVNFCIASHNVNGLADVTKRRMAFKMYRKLKSAVICLQETHIKSCLLPVLKCQWGGEVFLAGESSQQNGVAILISKNLEFKVTVLASDVLGRYLMLQLEIDDRAFILLNVYFPTSGMARAQLDLLAELEQLLEQHVGENLYIVGDFNVCLDSDLDRYNHVSSDVHNTEFRKELYAFINGFSLSDIGRIRNENRKMFTWTRGTKASRLNYIFVSEFLTGFIRDYNCYDAPFSDHRIVSVSLGQKSIKRGPGFWKMDPTILEREEVIEEIATLIPKVRIESATMNPQMSWEFLKLRIRETIILASKRIRREREELVVELEQKIAALSSNSDLSEDELEALNRHRRELYSIMRQREHLSYLRSRCRWARFGDKPSKYFLNLEKNNYSNKVVSSLYNDQDQLLVNPNEILDFEKKHFEDRYKITVDNARLPDIFSEADSGKLDDLDRACLEDPFTKEELWSALSSMKNGRSPGSDGIVAEFYKRFWHLLADWFIESVNFAFEKGSLSCEQYRGVITLIPKKDKDKRFIRNWRPITLLNLDYKILAKCIASRLGGTITKLISPDQSGFVAGRFIGVNLRNTQDIIDACLVSDEGGLIISLDYASAFDTLDRTFLSKALNSSNFGPNFIRWIELMYSGAEGCVVNNGISSGWFGMAAGLRQGCPASPLLFILAVEKFSHAIRQNQLIKGIVINGNEYKISQYADDTTLFFEGWSVS